MNRNHGSGSGWVPSCGRLKKAPNLNRNHGFGLGFGCGSLLLLSPEAKRTWFQFKMRALLNHLQEIARFSAEPWFLCFSWFPARRLSGQNWPVYIFLATEKNIKSQGTARGHDFRAGSKGEVVWAELASVHIFGQPQKHEIVCVCAEPWFSCFSLVPKKRLSEQNWPVDIVVGNQKNTKSHGSARSHDFRVFLWFQRKSCLSRIGRWT